MTKANKETVWRLTMEDVRCVIESMPEPEKELLKDITLSDMDRFYIEGWDEYLKAYLECLVDRKKKISESLNLLPEFLKQLDAAIAKHSSDNVDVIKDEEGAVYGTYHSKNNSFPVTDTFDLDISDEKIQEICDSRDIGYSH